MIKRINKIENFGIYQDYRHDGELSDFSTYNLFYGWNGCGKSTLSRMFRVLEKKELHENYKDARFKIVVDNDKEISNENLDKFNEKIYVFNTDFIKDNIDWDKMVNSILILSEKNIEDTKAYNQLSEELNGNVENHVPGYLKQTKDLQETQVKENDELEKVLTNAAKNIKNSLGIIATNDNYYLSYNKGKLRIFIDSNQATLRETGSLLSRSQVDSLTKQARPEKKDVVTESRKIVDVEELGDIREKVNELLCRKVTVNVIERLRDNPALSDWVQNGLEIHKNNKSEICEFCGQVMPQNRINELESHFNQEMKRLQNDIQILERDVTDRILDYEMIKIEKLKFYSELEADIDKYNNDIKTLTSQINAILNDWLLSIKAKQQNPFEVIKSVDDQISGLITKYNLKVETLNSIIDLHNDKTKNFEDKIKKAKSALELHYAKEQLNSFQYFKRQKEADDREKTISKLREIIREKNKKLLDIEAKLSNETIGAQQFNEKIEKFVGYRDIYLRFNKDKRGYEILRSTDNTLAKNLSEGEKSAIAFIYFMTKLKENSNRVEDSIIVIDDPISSFDSNKLFNAYAYLRSECDTAKQLFILTHNFNYFKLLRGWISQKKSRIDKTVYYHYRMYKIETTIKDSLRTGCIKNAGQALNQTSEYDYIFSKVYSYKDKKELTRDELVTCGNIARKLVEAFLSFKFPKQRANLEQLLEKALPKGGENDINRERIYKFINMYSHHLKIDIFDELDEDNTLSETPNVMRDILDMIKNNDETHFNDMVSWAEEELNA